FGLRTNVWGALALVLIGIALLIVQSKHTGIEPSPYRPGRSRKDIAVESSDPDDFVDVSAPPSTDEEPEAAATSIAAAH
ncbi:MAG: prolipoprotein diacylglyceryl transferase, partial [Microbacterium sp.]